MRVKELESSSWITSWNQMREEILEITRTQQTVHRQSTIAHAARSDSEEQGRGQRKQIQRQRQGRQEQRQRQGSKVRTVKENKERRSEKVPTLQRNRPQEIRVQEETERLCRRRRETGGSIAAPFQRHSDGKAVAVLTPRREAHVDIRPGHASCEQPNVMRVFQWANREEFGCG